MRLRSNGAVYAAILAMLLILDGSERRSLTLAEWQHIVTGEVWLPRDRTPTSGANNPGDLWSCSRSSPGS